MVKDSKYALEIMKQELKNKYICPEVKYAFEASIKALEKQIPMKAKPHKKIPGICKCPICKVDLCAEDGKKIYCPDCGQAIIV